VLGGLLGTPVGETARVDAYDIADDEWTQVASLPVATHHIGAAAVGGHVYAIGGLRTLLFTPTSDVYRYDAGANRWDAVAPLPTARGAMAVAVANGRIHAIAGDSRGAVGDHAAYIPEENRWIELKPYPLAREHIAAATVDGQIYVVGGRGPLTTAAHRWNEAAGDWVQLPPMNQRRAGHAAAALNGLLVTFGGEGNLSHPDLIFPEVEFYDPGGNRWTQIDDMAAPRHGIGAVTVGNRIYVPGGADQAGFGHVDTHDALEIGE
jgi:N-acetylneuraminic acid mutarotase